jgi:pSer/pThr/pTyr-binding forkhead associated (FHA) protein
VGSHYHQAGEKQEIMLDVIILGRDTDCHVRFDENFRTVSHHHASIVKEGDNWRLIHLSKKNTTFLNGKAVQDSWYLQSGDEIQLAVNGPKLIFRIPTETTEFKFTQRLSSFKEQVIRPYQTAFIIVCCVIVLLIAGGVAAGIIIKQQSDNIERIERINEEQRALIDSLYKQLLETNATLEQTALQADAAQQEAIKAKSLAFKEKAERIKSQKNLQDVQTQMQQLREEMNSFYNEIINGEKQ